MRGAIRVQSPRLYGNPYYAGIALLPELPRLTIHASTKLFVPLRYYLISCLKTHRKNGKILGKTACLFLSQKIFNDLGYLEILA